MSASEQSRRRRRLIVPIIVVFGVIVGVSTAIRADPPTIEVSVEVSPANVSPGGNLTVHVIVTATLANGKTVSIRGQEAEVIVRWPQPKSPRTFKVRSCSPKTIDVPNDTPPGPGTVDIKITKGPYKDMTAHGDFQVNPI